MDVGIIIALEEEFGIFDGTIDPLRTPIPDDSTGDVFYTFGTPSNHTQRPYDCVACFIGGMGPTGAALMTQQMILRWNPKNIVMVGIAAGISKNVRLGDVIVADAVDSYIDSARIGAEPEIEFAGEVYRCTAEYVRSLANFKFSNRSIYDHWAKGCARRLRKVNSGRGVKKGKGDGFASPMPSLHVGPIASGPVVVASSDFQRLLLKRNRKILGIDMEAAGMLAAVHRYIYQRHTLVLRGVSDFGDERKSDLDKIGGGSFRSYAMSNAIELLWHILSAGMLHFSERGQPEHRVTSVSQVVPRTSYQIFEGVADRASWCVAVNHVLRHIQDDMYTEGDFRGGWGRSYAGRYQARTYPQGMPPAYAPQPDTPSGTAMIVEGLSYLRQIPDILSQDARDIIDGCLRETSEYFHNRFDPVTGSVGVKTLLAAGDTAAAGNLRHSALALKAFHSLPGRYSQLGRCSEYLIRSSEITDLESEHVLKIVAVMSGLDWISATDDLKRGLPEANKLPYLIKKAEVALLKNWSPTARGWFDGKNRTTTLIWYSLLALKDLSKMNVTLDHELVGCGEHTLLMMFDCLREMPDGKIGMPYRIDGPPDLGMSCMLFEILTRAQPTPQAQSILRGLGRFITAHACLLDSSDHDYVKDTYPWTLVSLFGGLSVLLCKERE